MIKWPSGFSHFLVVLVPYLILLIYTTYVYASFSGDLSRDLPRWLMWIPVLVSGIIPVTYGVLIFRMGAYLNPGYKLMLGFFMATALFAMTFAVHMMGTID